MNAEYFSGVLGKVSDKYVMEAITYRQERKSVWLKWGAVAACLGLIFTAALPVLSGILSGGDRIEPPNDSDVPGLVAGRDGSQSGDGPSQSVIVESTQSSGGQEIVIDWDKIVVNESAGLAADAARRYYDPDLYDMEAWGEEEIAACYGWNLLPDYIPDGLSDGGSGPGGYACREKATGEIVEEQVVRSFWPDFHEDGSPKSDDDLYIPAGFRIQASRLGILHCALLLADETRTNDFGGVSVTLTHCSMKHGPFDPTQKAPDGLSNMPAGYYDLYAASFTLDGVEYEIVAQRLELEEVVRIAVSVIDRLTE